MAQNSLLCADVPLRNYLICHCVCEKHCTAVLLFGFQMITIKFVHRQFGKL